MTRRLKSGPYRVHTGFIRCSGVNRWRYFPTKLDAAEYCHRRFCKTGIVLSIEATPPRAKRPYGPPAPIDWQSMLHYLQSRQWRAIRQQVFERDGHACTRCGTPDQLTVHHLTYERRFRERLADLTTLCHTHHGALHGDDKRHATACQLIAAATKETHP